MNAQEVLDIAFDYGIDIQVQGNNLRLKSANVQSDVLVAKIRKYKREITLLLAANYNCKSADTDYPLKQYEQPLFNHLLICPYCHVEAAQYCVNAYAIGSVYDALLLNCDDAPLRRANLALRVDRMKIEG